MALAATTSRLLKVVGETGEVVIGSDTLSTTSLVVTVPQLTNVQGVILTGVSTTVAYVSATSGNTFTITGGNGEVVAWMAWGKAKI